MSEFKVNHVLESYMSLSRKIYSTSDEKIYSTSDEKNGSFCSFSLPDSYYNWRTDAAFFAREKELRIQEKNPQNYIINVV